MNTNTRPVCARVAVCTTCGEQISQVEAHSPTHTCEHCGTPTFTPFDPEGGPWSDGKENYKIVKYCVTHGMPCHEVPHEVACAFQS